MLTSVKFGIFLAQCMCVCLFLIDVTAVRRIINALCCRPWMKEIRQDDYITTFHLVHWCPVEDLQPCATDMDSGLCGLLLSLIHI